MLKLQTWRPDTHPGCTVEIEWEYDPSSGRETGREQRGVSVRYPDGTLIHRDTDGQDVADRHYRRLIAEHMIKNQAYSFIVNALPEHMKKLTVDRDGDAVLDERGTPKRALKDKHRPSFNHLGNGRYEFTVPGLDEVTHRDLSAKMAARFGDGVSLLEPHSSARTDV